MDEKMRVGLDQQTPGYITGFETHTTNEDNEKGIATGVIGDHHM